MARSLCSRGKGRAVVVAPAARCGVHFGTAASPPVAEEAGGCGFAAPFVLLTRSPRCACRYRPRVRPSPAARARHSAVPRLGFPPGAPLSEAPLFMRIIGRGASPSPLVRWRSLAGGNRTAAIFVSCAAALRGPSAGYLSVALSIADRNWMKTYQQRIDHLMDWDCQRSGTSGN